MITARKDSTQPVEYQLEKSRSGFDPRLFEQLAGLEDDSFWFKGRNRIICWAIKQFFPAAVDFLEIGCGTGFVLKHLARQLPMLRLNGSELYPEGLEYASQRLPNINLFQLDALNISFDKSFDVIGAFDVLEHIEDDNLVLSQIFKAIRPGGGILLTVPQHMFLWSQSDTHAHHCRRYSLSDLKSKVEGAGFSVVAHTSFVSFLLPAMLASRLRQKLFPGEYDVMAELRIQGALGTLLEKVLELELFMIRQGARFPCGGSLLMVAKKAES